MMQRKLRVLLVAFVLLLSVVAYILVAKRISPIEQGRLLAEQKCSLCHLVPQPGLLTKEKWKEGVLPFMAFRMGLRRNEIRNAINSNELSAIMSVVPDSALVTEAEFRLIEHYYVNSAPAALKNANTAKLAQTKTFTASFIPGFDAKAITLLHHDPLGKKLYVGDHQGKLFSLTNNFDIVDSTQLSSPASEIAIERDEMRVALVGSLLPTDLPRGKLISFESQTGKMKTILDSLQRPAHFQSEDLDGDGRKEIIVSAFGNYTGSLSLYSMDGPLHRRVLLSASPGARMTAIYDWDNDGRQDIIALMTQGDERIVLYRNEGSLSFKEVVLFRFPAVYGSSYFQIVDFDKDSFPDILYTNGDNGDYTNITKPYHAVRILRNLGGDLKEVWSQQYPGAWQARAADFDEDGHYELALISLFPDADINPSGFTFFENTDSPFVFTPTLVSQIPEGRWMDMEILDIENDGDEDIVLGSFRFEELQRNRPGAPSKGGGTTSHIAGLYLLMNRTR
jgi:hypothetical protein